MIKSDVINRPERKEEIVTFLAKIIGPLVEERLREKKEEEKKCVKS